MPTCPYKIIRTERQKKNQKRRIILEDTATSVGFLDPRSFSTLPKASVNAVGASSFNENLYGIYVDPNGQYVIGHDTTDNLIRRFEMTTPGDLSTLTDTEDNGTEYTGTFTNTLTLRNSGQNMYSGVSINTYYTTFGTAYDPSTIVLPASTQSNGSYHYQDLSEDGVHLLIVYPITTQYAYYQLSTPYDVTTRGTAISTGTFSPTLGGAYNKFQYSSDGAYVWGTSYTGERLDVWSLSTAYDPSTASHLGEFHFELAATANRSFCQTDFDGLIYCWDGSSQLVHQFGPADESGAIDEWSTTAESSKANFTTSAYSGCWSDNGLYFYYHAGLANAIGRQTASTEWDPSTLGAQDHSLAEPASTSTSVGMAVCNEGKTLIIASGSNALKTSTLGTAYNVSTGGAFSSHAVTCAGGFVMAKHGMTYYCSSNGAGSQTITQYDCSTIWDVSTGSANGTLDISGLGLGAGYPDGLALNGDGTKIYILGPTGNVYYYNMSTPWDISTASYGGTQDFPSPASLPQSFYVNQYGENELFGWDGTNNDLYKFTRTGG